MTFEETTRCARRFLCGPGEYRKLYQLAIDWRRRLEGDQVGEHTTRRLTALSPFVTSGRGHRAGAAPWTRNPNRLDPAAILPQRRDTKVDHGPVSMLALANALTELTGPLCPVFSKHSSTTS